MKDEKLLINKEYLGQFIKQFLVRFQNFDCFLKSCIENAIAK